MSINRPKPISFTLEKKAKQPLKSIFGFSEELQNFQENAEKLFSEKNYPLAKIEFLKVVTKLNPTFQTIDLWLAQENAALVSQWKQSHTFYEIQNVIAILICDIKESAISHQEALAQIKKVNDLTPFFDSCFSQPFDKNLEKILNKLEINFSQPDALAGYRFNHGIYLLSQYSEEDSDFQIEKTITSALSEFKGALDEYHRAMQLAVTSEYKQKFLESKRETQAELVETYDKLADFYSQCTDQYFDEDQNLKQNLPKDTINKAKETLEKALKFYQKYLHEHIEPNKIKFNHYLSVLFQWERLKFVDPEHKEKYEGLIQDFIKKYKLIDNVETIKNEDTRQNAKEELATYLPEKEKSLEKRDATKPIKIRGDKMKKFQTKKNSYWYKKFKEEITSKRRYLRRAFECKEQENILFNFKELTELKERSIQYNENTLFRHHINFPSDVSKQLLTTAIKYNANFSDINRLFELGIEQTPSNTNYAPIHEAIALNNLPVVELLIRHETFDKTAWNYNQGMLNYAFRKNAFSITNFLMKNFAEQCQSNLKNFGEDFLIKAITHLEVETVDLLLKNNIRIKDKEKLLAELNKNLEKQNYSTENIAVIKQVIASIFEQPVQMQIEQPQQEVELNIIPEFIPMEKDEPSISQPQTDLDILSEIASNSPPLERFKKTQTEVNESDDDIDDFIFISSTSKVNKTQDENQVQDINTDENNITEMEVVPVEKISKHKRKNLNVVDSNVMTQEIYNQLSDYYTKFKDKIKTHDSREEVDGVLCLKYVLLLKQPDHLNDDEKIAAARALLEAIKKDFALRKTSNNNCLITNKKGMLDYSDNIYQCANKKNCVTLPEGDYGVGTLVIRGYTLQTMLSRTETLKKYETRFGNQVQHAEQTMIANSTEQPSKEGKPFRFSHIDLNVVPDSSEDELTQSEGESDKKEMEDKLTANKILKAQPTDLTTSNEKEKPLKKRKISYDSDISNDQSSVKSNDQPSNQSVKTFTKGFGFDLNAVDDDEPSMSPEVEHKELSTQDRRIAVKSSSIKQFSIFPPAESSARSRDKKIEKSTPAHQKKQ